MVIVTRKHLAAAARAVPDARDEIAAWTGIVAQVRWRNFKEVRATFKDADYVEGYVIFNIRRNRYRLVTIVHFAKDFADRKTEGHVYVRSFLTHRQYDDRKNWDKEYGNDL
jgi:mRNA interferase HigB